MLYTSLTRIRERGLSDTESAELIRHLRAAGHDQSRVPFDAILTCNGFDIALWALRACDGAASFACTYVLDLARRAYPIWRARYPSDVSVEKQLDTIERFLHGQADQQGLLTAQQLIRNTHDDASAATRKAAFSGSKHYASYAAAGAAIGTASAAVHATNIYACGAGMIFALAKEKGGNERHAFDFAYSGGRIALLT